VSKRTPATRRRLSNVTRKGIMSYYTQEEAQTIAEAAEKLHITMSSFVANAALREAAIVNPKKPAK